MRRISTLFIIIQISLRAIAQPVPTDAYPFKMSVEQYVNIYAPVAIEEMHKTRIPASITLAQGLLESGNGNSRLAIEGNNHFGIKCKKDWAGETIREDDDEEQECFRKYKSALESYKDHSDFLKKNQRYAFLFDLEPTDYKAWAYGLKKAGYATNPKYPELLITTIEKNGLARFDQVQPGVKEIQKIEEEKKEELIQTTQLSVNGVPAIVAKPGISYAQIALENDMRVWQIYKYNDLNKDAVIRAGDTIYLKPKNYKSQVPFFWVTQNETMHAISQRFAVKLSRLLHKNGMSEGQEPANGETVYLRDKRKEPIRLRELPRIADTDTMYNNRVYEDPKKNIETQEPTLPHDLYSLEGHGIKEDMAFFHIVQKGETLFSIAHKYNVRIEGVKDLNQLQSDKIKEGDRLIINPNQPKEQAKEEQVVPGYHSIKQGETLYSIARLYNTSVKELTSLNELLSDTLKVGDELIVVPLNGEKLPQSDSVVQANNEPVFHEVKEKETVYSLSRKYNVSQEQIRNLNNMIDNNIRVGQRLRIR